MTTNHARRLLGMVALLSTMSGCGKKGNEPSFLLAAVQKTAPTISGKITVASLDRRSLFDWIIPSAVATPAMPSDCRATYGYMCLGWEFFTLLREFDPATNESLSGEDKVASENLYYELNLAGQAYENFAPQANALPGATEIASPFNFGATNMAGERYDHAKNGITSVQGFGYSRGIAAVAFRQEGATRHFLISQGSNEASGWTAGRHLLVMQGVLNETTGDVELNFVQYGKYPASAGSLADQITVMRTHIRGNQNTHYFEFEAASTNTGSGPGCWNWGSVQGAGYSKGAGKHYLVRYRGTNASQDSNNVTGPGTTGAYYCVAADTTKASFGSAIYDHPAGFGIDEIPADCADYKATVSQLPSWEISGTMTGNNNCAAPIEPQSSDYPVKSDSALFTGTGPLKLGLSF